MLTGQQQHPAVGIPPTFATVPPKTLKREGERHPRKRSHGLGHLSHGLGQMSQAVGTFWERWFGELKA